ncbi:hypothetical protein BLNAU_22733 [Blattamonas nauphoetae]|uniref:Uncharacterized protein n=1 Tax=Blattamonas nauphoetae TaxID=2049346 RepID=A0ABQ9WS82_9EUKA|nr:hypothetical protein BLNAU_22733 [Blattamonas nauphoetae]
MQRKQCFIDSCHLKHTQNENRHRRSSEAKTRRRRKRRMNAIRRKGRKMVIEKRGPTTKKKKKRRQSEVERGEGWVVNVSGCQTALAEKNGYREVESGADVDGIIRFRNMRWLLSHLLFCHFQSIKHILKARTLFRIKRKALRDQRTNRCVQHQFQVRLNSSLVLTTRIRFVHLFPRHFSRPHLPQNQSQAEHQR